MVAGVGAVIFSTGTYYPQVHPQVVENPAGRAEAFDQTSSHAADMILAAVNACSLIALLNLTHSLLLAEQIAPPLPRMRCWDTLRGYLRREGRLMPDHDSHHGYIASKDDYLKRLRRIEGQARGLQKMIEEEQYCIDILTQVSAMTRALQSVALGLLDEHLSHCVVRAAAEGGAEADIKIEEASSAIARLVRS
jgi:DNA-binding FrmR family transcriptional regulator